MKRRNLPAVFLFLAVAFQLEAVRSEPNIVIILADDLGYGDVRVLNPGSKIPTPNLDRLAAEGMVFTDSHSPAAVCTPTRYGLLTGRYAWRTRLQSGVLGGYSPPLIDQDRVTLADMLHEAGYRTGGIGKWHLGMDLPHTDGSKDDLEAWEGDPGIDFGGLISDGPLNHGFDYYFGVSASLDMAPYVFIHNDRFSSRPELIQPAVSFPHFVRKGPRARDFVIEEVLDRLTDEAVHFIAERREPFFLYLALTAPHKPTQPHERFRGRTGLGEYGDFVAQVDWTVGQVLEAIDDVGSSDNTLVLFTSDNGSYMSSLEAAGDADHVTDPTVQGYFPSNHRANGPLRGTKADIWEGGHRVPLIARWPQRIASGSSCPSTVCLTDLFATCAEIVGAKVEEGTAPDSCSLLPMLRGEAGERALPVIHHSARGVFSIRQGRWKLVLGNGSGGREAPVGEPFGKPYQLFDLGGDLSESRDLAAEYPAVVERLTEAFEELR